MKKKGKKREKRGREKFQSLLNQYYSKVTSKQPDLAGPSNFVDTLRASNAMCLQSFSIQTASVADRWLPLWICRHFARDGNWTSGFHCNSTIGPSWSIKLCRHVADIQRNVPTKFWHPNSVGCRLAATIVDLRPCWLLIGSYWHLTGMTVIAGI